MQDWIDNTREVDGEMKKFEVGKAYDCEYRTCNEESLKYEWRASAATVTKRTEKTVTLTVEGADQWSGRHKVYIDGMGIERADTYGFRMHPASVK